ncbi:ATP-dependent nuclease [Leptospira ilyithenensis]|uniref:Uncharacterized protein n=1 Tax=Leptospira ilyithenensis TaxID=2484901 RepID=A0A4R9LS10_9LEPT|nr:ATP-binding protein [Leptospira ilyithenensis]TGN14007.1 hypothetical protein EHS11_03225 [Leptospira ilyithenensis]
MAKIYSLKISNFRSIRNFEQIFGTKNFICLIGRGDSGKSTILDAISYVLYPNWNLSFYDTDFYDGEINNPIEIQASLTDVPKVLLQDSKFGLFIRGLDLNTGLIKDELEDHHEIILTISLTVNKYLEPKWHVINYRNGKQSIEINANDRNKFNSFLVSDYIDRHFSWSKGSPLYSILKSEGNNLDDSNVIIDEFRQAKERIDSTSFGKLENVIEKIQSNASKFGLNISNTNNTIDFKDIALLDSKICLHEDKIPFRLKGKGSKRIISIAIQTELMKEGGIQLIDEIEQGLEPDRAQHLARSLKKNNFGQTFITTHSRDVLVELNAEDILIMKKRIDNLITVKNELQGCIRKNPEAFFAEKVIVCEGITEVGFCREINEFRINSNQNNAANLGIRFADGGGSKCSDYAQSFSEAGYEVCLFCDSDNDDFNRKKEALRKIGITIVDCENNNALEHQIFLDLPWEGIRELLNYQIDLIQESVKDSLLSAYKSYGYGTFPNDWLNMDILEMRKVLGFTSSKNKWFKNIQHGEFLSKVCLKYFEAIKDKHIGKQIIALSNWMDNLVN